MSPRGPHRVYDEFQVTERKSHENCYRHISADRLYVCAVLPHTGRFSFHVPKPETARLHAACLHSAFKTFVFLLPIEQIGAELQSNLRICKCDAAGWIVWGCHAVGTS